MTRSQARQEIVAVLRDQLFNAAGNPQIRTTIVSYDDVAEVVLRHLQEAHVLVVADDECQPDVLDQTPALRLTEQSVIEYYGPESPMVILQGQAEEVAVDASTEGLGVDISTSPEALALVTRIFAIMRDIGAHQIEVDYSGSGDDGEINGLVILPTEADTVYRTRDTGDETRLADMIWDLTSAYHGGFVNNDGGQGNMSFIIDATMTPPESFSWTHGDNYTETTNYDYRFGHEPPLPS